MFRFLKNLAGPYPNFDSIQCDTRGWQRKSDPDAELGPIWGTPEGDAIGLELKLRRPKLPQSMDLYGYRNVFLKTMQSPRGIPVELGSLRVAGCPGIRFIYKIPQRDGGTAYCGTLTIPFQRFSFIYAVHCGDQGASELRDSALAQRGITAVARAAQQWPPSTAAPHAELAQFDLEFPKSPLARLRRILVRIAESISIEERIACLPTCDLPQ